MFLCTGNRTGDEPAVVGCPTNKFQCYNGNCIWSAWLCDGDQDCTQGINLLSNPEISNFLIILSIVALKG